MSLQGKAIGVFIGCILGMFPLFFIGDDDHGEGAGPDKHKEASPPPPPS